MKTYKSKTTGDTYKVEYEPDMSGGGSYFNYAKWYKNGVYIFSKMGEGREVSAFCKGVIEALKLTEITEGRK